MDSLERDTMTQVWWRIIPLLASALLLNYLDKANLSFAALQMNHALGLSNTAYGMAANMLARRPDRSPSMPRRNRMWWPYQSAVVPASQVTIACAGSRRSAALT